MFLEVNPRGSRTFPFVAKATGVPLARIAARLTMGEKLADLDFPEPQSEAVCVKAPVFPFIKLRGLDPAPGPEMKSTGEVMGSHARSRSLSESALGNRNPCSNRRWSLHHGQERRQTRRYSFGSRIRGDGIHYLCNKRNRSCSQRFRRNRCSDLLSYR